MLLFLVTPYLVVAVQPCMEWIPSKKKCQIFSCPSPNLLILILQIPLNTSSCFAFGLEHLKHFWLLSEIHLFSMKTNRFFAKRELCVLFRCNFLRPKCSSLELLLSIKDVFFWLQKFLSLELVLIRAACQCFTMFRLSFQ